MANVHCDLFIKDSLSYTNYLIFLVISKSSYAYQSFWREKIVTITVTANAPLIISHIPIIRNE